MVKEFGMDMYTLLYVKWKTNKALLWSTGNSTQCYVAAWMGGELGRTGTHVCAAESLPYPPEAITTLLVISQLSSAQSLNHV